MSKITIDVNDTDLSTVLTILQNLKEGLLQNIEVDKRAEKSRSLYQPKVSRVIAESEKPSGKYLSTAAYKARLKK